MLLTRTTAAKLIRTQTGCARKTAEERVRQMQGKRDRARNKVLSTQVEAVIDELLTPPVITIRQLSDSQIARLQRRPFSKFERPLVSTTEREGDRGYE